VNANTGAFHSAFVQLLAAGGTMSIQVAGEDVHPLFGVQNDEMVNTFREDQSKIGSAKHAEYGVDSRVKFPAKIVITDADMVTGLDGMNIKNIPITVKTTDNTAQELTDEDSQAPLKFMAPIGTKWAAERVRFGDAYEYFKEWVSNPDDEPWIYPDDFYTYEGSMPAVSDYAPTAAEIAAAGSNTGGNNGNNNRNNNDGTTPPEVTGPTGHTATWSGTQAFTVNAEGKWEGNVSFDSNTPAFNNMGDGTYIRIYGYGTSNNWQVQLARQLNQYPWTWTELENYQRTGSFVNKSTTIEFGPLSAEEVQAIKDDGKLYVHGKNFVVKYIDIDNSGVEQEQSGGGSTTYEGTVLWDKGGGEATISSTTFENANAQVNNIIRIYVDSPSAGYWHVALYPGGYNSGAQVSDWEPANFTTAYNPQPSDFPGYVDYKIKNTTALNSVLNGGLIVQSTNLTSNGILAVTLIK
jgi:hypothetical protein